MEGTPVADSGTRAAGVTHLRALGTTVTVAVRPGRRTGCGRVRARATSSTPSTAPVAASGPTPRSSTCAAAGGRPVRVSALLYEAVSVACAVAERTGGAVDPTVGRAVEALGYDRDFAEVPARSAPPLRRRPVPAPGWWRIDLDDRTRSVAVPAGREHRPRRHGQSSRGRSGRAPHRFGDECRAHWSVWAATWRCRARPPTADGPSGSPWTARDLSRPARWYRSRQVGWPARARRCGPGAGERGVSITSSTRPPVTVPASHWRLVTVAAASCVDANAWSTAAVVWGESAPDRLERLGRARTLRPPRWRRVDRGAGGRPTQAKRCRRGSLGGRRHGDGGDVVAVAVVHDACHGHRRARPAHRRVSCSASSRRFASGRGRGRASRSRICIVASRSWPWSSSACTW